MKKPKRADFKNCIDPEFAYTWSMLTYFGWKQAKKNELLIVQNDMKQRKSTTNGR